MGAGNIGLSSKMFSAVFSSAALVLNAKLLLASDGALMTTDMTPDTGPEMDTVYQPGTPGGDWTEEEIDSTRRRLMQMMTPLWDEKVTMGLASKLGKFWDGQGEVTENVILRLVFHDCIPYMDGTGGCDGCLNWAHMDAETINWAKSSHYYKFTPPNATDNKGLDLAALALEKVYTTLDWPFQSPSLTVSLHQSGKSRADLWQLAGMISLELALERANRACDLDYYARQQVTLLESREKCEIKLTKPLKFKTGRQDCVSDDPEGRAYVTTKDENQPRLMSTGHQIIDYGRDFFNMDAEHFAALMAVHGATHRAAIGLKYTWFGAGYISNMYFKQLANKPLYKMGKGGDLSFSEDDVDFPIYNVAIGDVNGEPQAYTGWRTSCMMVWNTTMGGPCVLRPTNFNSADSPYEGKFANSYCITEVHEDGSCSVKSSTKCKDFVCDERGVLKGGRQTSKRYSIGSTPWSDDLSYSEKVARHSTAWSNQFAFPWEVGMMWNFTVEGEMYRPAGCEGIDEPFGTLTEPKWVLRNQGSPIWNSPPMKCGMNDYAPEGKAMHQIIEDFASDNELFAEKFIEAFGMMASNGYTELNDAPQNSWLGHYSLTQQGIDLGGDFESYIATNAPVTFTDATADPYICGHRGHAYTTCGRTFSELFELAGRELDHSG